MVVKRILSLSASCLIVLLGAGPAFAHAFLDHAVPGVGSEVSGSPPTLNLTYTEPVEPLFSTVKVTDANGARVDEGKPTPLEDGRVLSVKLKTLPPGDYDVEWHVTSIDTHKTEGKFTFTVKP